MKSTGTLDKHWAENFEKELKKMNKKLAIHASTIKGVPVQPKDISLFEKKLSQIVNQSVKLPPGLRDMYRQRNGFGVGWKSGDAEGYLYVRAFHLIFGTLNGSNVSIKSPDDEWVLDEIGPYAKVFTSLFGETEDAALYYRSKSSSASYKMNLNVAEYLQMALTVRALVPWQEFFIVDPNYKLNTRKANKFIDQLNGLFPDVDDSYFRERIKEIGE